jgi:MFS family permease
VIRKILGAVAGYIVHFFSVFLLFTGLSVALGPDRLFLPGNYDPSMTWILSAFVIGFIAAALGGYVAALIGKRGAVKIMAGLVVLIGAIVFVGLLRDHKPVETRTVELPTMEAMFKAREPLWVAAVNPLLLVIAVFAGGTLRKDKES